MIVNPLHSWRYTLVCFPYTDHSFPASNLRSDRLLTKLRAGCDVDCFPSRIWALSMVFIVKSAWGTWEGDAVRYHVHVLRSLPLLGLAV